MFSGGERAGRSWRGTAWKSRCPQAVIVPAGSIITLPVSKIPLIARKPGCFRHAGTSQLDRLPVKTAEGGGGGRSDGIENEAAVLPIDCTPPCPFNPLRQVSPLLPMERWNCSVSSLQPCLQTTPYPLSSSLFLRIFIPSLHYLRSLRRYFSRTSRTGSCWAWFWFFAWTCFAIPPVGPCRRILDLGRMKFCDEHRRDTSPNA